MHYNKKGKPILDGSIKKMEQGLNRNLEEGLLLEEKAERIARDRPNMDEDEEMANEILEGENLHQNELENEEMASVGKDSFPEM